MALKIWRAAVFLYFYFNWTNTQIAHLRLKCCPGDTVQPDVKPTSEGRVSSTRMFGPVVSGPKAQIDLAASRSQSYFVWKNSPSFFLTWGNRTAVSLRAGLHFVSAGTLQRDWLIVGAERLMEGGGGEQRFSLMVCEACHFFGIATPCWHRWAQMASYMSRVLTGSSSQVEHTHAHTRLVAWSSYHRDGNTHACF